MALLEVRKITKSFKDQCVINDVSIRFPNTGLVSITGESGCGKSTFLKVLSGELEPSKGEVSKEKRERLSVLKQDHFAFEEYTVLDTVIMGNQELYSIMKEKNEILSCNNNNTNNSSMTKRFKFY